MPAILSLDRDNVPLEGRVGPGQVRQLVAAKPRLEQRLDDRAHAAVAGGEQLPDLLLYLGTSPACATACDIAQIQDIENKAAKGFSCLSRLLRRETRNFRA